MKMRRDRGCMLDEHSKPVCSPSENSRPAWKPHTWRLAGLAALWLMGVSYGVARLMNYSFAPAPAPDPVSWASTPGRPAWNWSCSGAFLGQLSTLVLFLRQTRSVALAADQPVRTGNAPIRRSIGPNRRRVQNNTRHAPDRCVTRPTPGSTPSAPEPTLAPQSYY